MIDVGIHEMPMEEYLADPCVEPSLSSSIAKTLINRSPLHAWFNHPRLNPDHQEADAKHFDFGRAAHSLLLEGENVMAVIDADDWRKKATQEARDAARDEGKTPLLSKDAERVYAMRDAAAKAFRECPDLDGIKLEDGSVEQTCIWKQGGTWCRSRSDWWHRKADIMLDLKTTSQSAKPEAWCRKMMNWGYEFQSAFHRMGIRAFHPNSDPKFIFLVQETEPPYATSLVGMDPAWITLGEDKVRTAMALWAQCLADNHWPAYGARIHWPELPPWAMEKWAETTFDYQEDEIA